MNSSKLACLLVVLVAISTSLAAAVPQASTNEPAPPAWRQWQADAMNSSQVACDIPLVDSLRSTSTIALSKAWETPAMPVACGTGACGGTPVTDGERVIFWHNAKSTMRVAELSPQNTGLPEASLTRLRQQLAHVRGGADAETAAAQLVEGTKGGEREELLNLWRCFGYRNGKAQAARPVVACWDATTGQELWSSRLPLTHQRKHPYRGGAWATPAMGRGVVVIKFMTSVFALDLNNGRERWRHRWTDAKITSNSPVIVGNRVVIFDGCGAGRRLLCLDITTGRRLWEVHDPEPLDQDYPGHWWGTPAVMRHGEDSFLLVGLPQWRDKRESGARRVPRNLLTMYRLQDGSRAWQSDLVLDWNESPLVIGAGTIVTRRSGVLQWNGATFETAMPARSLNLSASWDRCPVHARLSTGFLWGNAGFASTKPIKQLFKLHDRPGGTASRPRWENFRPAIHGNCLILGDFKQDKKRSKSGKWELMVFDASTGHLVARGWIRGGRHHPGMACANGMVFVQTGTTDHPSRSTICSFDLRADAYKRAD